MTSRVGAEPRCWHTAGASERGSSHVAVGAANEDAWAASDDAMAAVIAVADGHGSKKCCRSADGARLAVDAAVGVIQAGLDAEHTALDLRGQLPAWGQQIVERWQQLVDVDSRSRPFSAEELRDIGTDRPSRDQVRLAYGTTLLAACATRHAVGALQVGDGDIIVVGGEDGTVLRPVPDDPRNVGNVTMSLAHPRAASQVRVADIDLGTTPVIAVLASTDGFGGAFADREWWRSVGGDLAERAKALTAAELTAQIPSWLEEPAEVAGDDTTLAMLLAAFEDAAVEPSVTALVPEPARTAPAPPPSSPPQSVPRAAAPSLEATVSRRSRMALALAAFAGLTVGGLAGWSLQSRDGDAGSNLTAVAPATSMVDPATSTPVQPSTPTSASSVDGGNFTLVADDQAVLVSTDGEPQVESIPKVGDRSIDMTVAYDAEGGYWAVDGATIRHITVSGERAAAITLPVEIRAIVVRSGRIWMLDADTRVLSLPLSCGQDCVPECFDPAVGSGRCEVDVARADAATSGSSSSSTNSVPGP